MSSLLVPGTELETCYKEKEVKVDNKRTDIRDPDIPGPVWPGSSNWNLREIDKDRNNAGDSRDQKTESASGTGDRCFEIRHQRLVPNVHAPRPGNGGEKSRTTLRDFHNAGQKPAQQQTLAIRIQRESDHEENNVASDGDSIEELSDDGEEGSDDRMNDKSKEDMDRVIAELTSALIQSKGLLR